MENVKKTLHYFWIHSWKYPRDVLLGLLFLAQVTFMAIFMPLLIGFGVGKIANPSSVSLSFAKIISLMLGCTIMGVILNRIAQRAVDRFELAATSDIYQDIANHLLSQSYEFHSKSFSGALITQSTKLANAYISFVDTLFLTNLRWIIVVFASSITLLIYDRYLGLIMLTTAVLGSVITVFMVRKRYPLQKNANKKVSEQNAYYADMITNAITVKTFAAESNEVKQFDTYLKTTEKAHLNAWAKQINTNNVILIIVSIMNISVLSYGIHAIQRGLISASVFIAAELYAVRLAGAFWDASSMVRQYERSLADAHEMIEILQHRTEVIDAAKAKELNVTSGKLELKNVSFHYSDSSAESNVLNNLSIVINPGEKIGLVGRSGGGKTTITKLVLRFMDIQSGSIEIDGQNIAEVTQKSLRQNIAYVPQEPLLFHRTITQNISYGKPGVTKDQIIEAAKLAQAHEFIMKLPKAYETEVGERGVKLSGGQRQRVAIARALLKDSPILLLDEATSALDSEGEVLIQKALWKLMKGRTALVIAHRLSTIQKMDRIIVIDGGRIAEQGTHQELIKQQGIYAELWDHQSGGFLEA